MSGVESRTQDPAHKKIGLIAGSGQFPLLFAHAARQAGVEVVVVGFEGETDLSLSKYASEFHMAKLGQLNKIIKTFRKAGISRAAMAGAINKTKLYTRLRPDWRGVKFLNSLRNKKDDSLLRAFAEELEREGIKIEPSTMFLPSLLAPPGILTRRKPNHREQADIVFGWKLAKAIGHLDIGQCLVVKNQAVLAVEGIDGTDSTILRGGRLCREGAVIVKVSKPTQDLRFDVPAVGYDTIETMKRVKARVLVVEADKTLIFDREKMIDAADAADISVLVQRDEQLPDRYERPSRIGLPDFVGSWPAQTIFPIAEQAPALIRKARPDALRIGVVGVGYLGRFHAQKYARLPEAQLVAVADINEEQARKVASEVDTDSLTDYRHMMGQVDAVSIVTPTMNHFAIARDFLSNGIHVLLEKPMTTTLEEADQLISLAEDKGCTLQIGHLERFNSAFAAIAPRLKNPMFLEATRLALFNDRGLEVDVILDLMIHDIDIVLHVVHSPLRQIRASGVSVLTELPDIANVRMEFANGAVANLIASRISLKNQRKLRIFQEDCYVAADYARKTAYAVYKEEEADDSGYPEISVQEIEIEERDSLEEEITSFLRSVRCGSKPLVDGHDGRKALAVALSISQQIDEQMREKWEPSRKTHQGFF